MLSWVRHTLWNSDTKHEASVRLVPGDTELDEHARALEGGFLSDCDTDALPVEPPMQLEQGSAAAPWVPEPSSSEQPGASSSRRRPQNWLLRLGTPCTPARRHRGSRLSRSDRARHAILAWRLKKPYLVYCAVCSILTAGLLIWNVVKGMQNNWNLPQWKHHRWEEVAEVSIGVLIVAETLLTMRVLGLRDFFRSGWCIFDFGVAALTVISIGYGLEHLGRHGEICEADVPLLLARFVLQPARVLALTVGTYRTQQMQTGVQELRVDFGTLPSNGTAFASMVELP